VSIKDIRNQGGGGRLFSADILRTREILQMRTSILFGAKTSDFSKFMVCPHGQGMRGLNQCGLRERGINFSRFCADSFMDGLL